MTRDLSSLPFIQTFNKFIKILDYQNVENFYLNFEYVHMYVADLFWNLKRNSIEVYECIAEPNSSAKRF